MKDNVIHVKCLTVSLSHCLTPLYPQTQRGPQWEDWRGGGERDDQLQAHAGAGRQQRCPTQSQDYEGLQGDHEEEEGESYLYCEYQTEPGWPRLAGGHKTKSHQLIIDEFSLTESHHLQLMNGNLSIHLHSSLPILLFC